MSNVAKIIKSQVLALTAQEQRDKFNEFVSTLMTRGCNILSMQYSTSSVKLRDVPEGSEGSVLGNATTMAIKNGDSVLPVAFHEHFCFIVWEEFKVEDSERGVPNEDQ